MSESSPRVFNGRYEILRHLARGGMAEVYLAHDLMLDRRVALKVLFPELSIDQSFVERFRREAQAAANLSHPNIVAVFDWGEEEGTYFIVMEYVEGRTLGQIIRNEGALLPDRAADIAADVAAALASAHQAGVVHRDVKPGNVLINRQGQVKVTDFGIARAADTDVELTQTGAVMGTATYFSPEQAQGMRVDARSDVYSLGVVLYEMVTGRAPFTAENPMAIAVKHVQEQPRSPREINPDLPPGMEAIILQALAKNPADRYASAQEIRDDLLRFRQGRTVFANPTVVAPVYEPEPTAAAARYDRTEAVTPAPEYADTEDSRRTGAFVLLLLIMLIVLGGLLYLFAREAGIIGDTAAGEVTVPQVVGMQAEEAAAAIEATGLQARQQVEPNEEVEPGIVFEQNPPAGDSANRGDTVTLLVSGGAPELAVPDVVGENVDDAVAILEEEGFSVIVEEEDSDEPEGEVISQDPDAGVEVARGSSVTIVVSTGQSEVEVPDVAGESEGRAANILGQAGFETEIQRVPSEDVPEGEVIRTDPPAGSFAPEGSTVTMFVSSGEPEPERVQVPNVVGMTRDQARAAIERAGLVYQEGTPALVTDPEREGTVVSQTPSGGTRVEEGSTVTVRIGRQATTTSTTQGTTTTTAQ